MKSLQQFRTTNPVTEPVEEGTVVTADFKISKDGRRVKAHRIKLNADTGKEIRKEDVEQIQESVDAPFVLLLKRTAIRLYPNDVKVAVYYCAKLKREFAVPFTKDGAGMIQATEELELDQYAGQLDEAVMDTLHKIVSNKSAQRVKFATGETRSVDHYTASAITQVHKALNDSNKQKFADMVHKSPAHFSKASEFAFSKVK